MILEVKDKVDSQGGRISRIEQDLSIHNVVHDSLGEHMQRFINDFEGTSKMFRDRYEQLEVAT